MAATDVIKSAFNIASAKLEALDVIAKIVHTNHAAETVVTLIKGIIALIAGPNVTADQIRAEIVTLQRVLAENDRNADSEIDKKFPR